MNKLAIIGLFLLVLLASWWWQGTEEPQQAPSTGSIADDRSVEPGTSPSSSSSPNDFARPSAEDHSAVPDGLRSVDLRRDEGRGGHTLERHVGLDERDLEERLERNRNLDTASSFYDLETAEAVVAATLDAQQDRVRDWLQRSGDRPNLALRYRGSRDRPVGISLSRRSQDIRQCGGARVVLGWKRGDWYVLTSYPSCG